MLPLRWHAADTIAATITRHTALPLRAPLRRAAFFFFSAMLIIFTLPMPPCRQAPLLLITLLRCHALIRRYAAMIFRAIRCRFAAATFDDAFDVAADDVVAIAADAAIADAIDLRFSIR